MDRGRETDEENSKTLLLSPAFSLSAGSYLLWLCCSTETWADIKSDAKKYMHRQTHRQAHAHRLTQIIFTSCAPLPSVDISWLPWKLKAHMQTVIHVLICVCRCTHVAAQTLKHTHKHENTSLTELCITKKRLTLTHTQTHTHITSFRLKMKDAKLKGSACIYPLSTNLSPPFSVWVSLVPRPSAILTITSHQLRDGDVKSGEKYNGALIR